MSTHRFRHTPHHRPGTAVAGLALAAALAAVVVLLLAADAAGADSYRIWDRHYAPTAGYDSWSYIAKGPSGTVYVAGTRNLESGKDRMVVAKYTAGGRRVWLRTYAGRGVAWASALAVDARGNAYVVGQEVRTGATFARMCLLKLANRTGRVTWIRRYHAPGSTFGDFPRSIALGAKGAVYVAGSVMTSGDGWDAALLKYIDKGRRASRAWVRTYGYSRAPVDDNADRGVRVVVDGRGRVYWGGESSDGAGRTIAFVRRVKVATGGPVWTRRIWVDDHELSLADLAAFPSGGVVLAATRSWVTGLGTGAYVSRYTARGSKVFGTLIDGPDGERVQDLAVGTNGDIAVAGTRAKTSPTLQSAWVARGDRRFSLPWQAVYDSPQAGDYASFSSVAVGAGGAVYCGGSAGIGFITGYDFLMAKYSAAGSRLWVDPYDDLDASQTDACMAVLYVGGPRPGLYGAGRGGATPGGEAVLIKYRPVGACPHSWSGRAWRSPYGERRRRRLTP